MTSCHDVFGRPDLSFPWDGFQKYSFLRIQSMSILWRWPNHWRWHFLMTAVSWGCLVLDLMELLVICWDHATHIRSCAGSACRKHQVWPHLSECCWCSHNSVVQIFGICPTGTTENSKILETVHHLDQTFITKWGWRHWLAWWTFTWSLSFCSSSWDQDSLQ